MSRVSVSDVMNESADQQRLQELEAIFHEHYRLIYRTAFAVTGNGADAEDVVQTIFVRLLRRGFPPDLKKNPGAYLYRAAVNSSLNSIRGEKRRICNTDLAGLEARSAAVDSESAEEIHRRLYDAVGQLAPDAAHILILRYAHDYSDAEIAKLLGLSRTTVAVRLFRSRARLRKLMGDRV
jgi:RNA polymerase sigma-70 factor, ECF subfamily